MNRSIDTCVTGCVTGSWIVDNDTGDEDASVVPERFVIIEIVTQPPSLSQPPSLVPGMNALSRMVAERRAVPVEAGFEYEHHHYKRHHYGDRGDRVTVTLKFHIINYTTDEIKALQALL